MFVVDDLLVSFVLFPFLRGLRDQGFDQVYSWLGEQGVKLKTRHRYGTKMSKAEQLDQLKNRVAKDPDLARSLTQAAFASAGAASDDTAFLTTVNGFFEAVFQAILTLRHPAVLEGFLTGEGDVCVIDVRTRTFGESYRSPGISALPPQCIPCIDFGRANRTNPPITPFIWLLHGQANQPETVKSLMDCAKGVPRVLDIDDPLLKYMQDLPAEHQANLVVEIRRDIVKVQAPQIYAPVCMVDVHQPANDSQLPWGETLNGVRAMRETLTQQVQDQIKYDKSRTASFEFPRIAGP